MRTILKPTYFLQTAIFTLAATSSLHADNLIWDLTSGDGTTITGGTGTWENGTGNWNNAGTSDTWNNSAPDNATFQGTSGAIMVSGDIVAGTINMSSSGYTMIVDVGTSLTATTFNDSWGTNLAADGTVTFGTYNVAYNNTKSIFGSGIINTTNFSVRNYSTMNFSGATLNNSGNFFLGDASNQTGFFNQTDGTVNLTSATAGAIRIGHWSNPGSAYTISGGTLNALASNTIVGWDGKGTLGVSGEGTANLLGIGVGTRGGAGVFELTGGRVNVGANGIFGTGAGTKTISLGAGTLGALANWSSSMAMTLTDTPTGVTIDTLDSANNTTARTITLSGVLSGTGSLTKASLGTLTLSGNNTYGGTTTVTGGKLVVNGSIASSSLTSVNAGGAIGGSGTVGALNVAGILAPGTSPGTLTTGTLTLANTAVLQFELTNGNFTVGGGINDLVTVNGDLILDGTLQLSELGGVLASGTYRLFDYTGQLTNNILEIDPTFLANHAGAYIDTSISHQVNLVVVPEASITLLGGVGALALLRRRRNG